MCIACVQTEYDAQLVYILIVLNDLCNTLPACKDSRMSASVSTPDQFFSFLNKKHTKDVADFLVLAGKAVNDKTSLKQGPYYCLTAPKGNLEVRVNLMTERFKNAYKNECYQKYVVSAIQNHWKKGTCDSDFDVNKIFAPSPTPDTPKKAEKTKKTAFPRSDSGSSSKTLQYDVDNASSTHGEEPERTENVHCRDVTMNNIQDLKKQVLEGLEELTLKFNASKDAEGAHAFYRRLNPCVACFLAMADKLSSEKDNAH
mmetsp:Transcript_25839/g.66502  ORF Transcript_25839/g.66502 Transcript_25839/m.66502 type:complete len:257 (+) Transcript_25839:56-826(+)